MGGWYEESWDKASKELHGTSGKERAKESHGTSDDGCCLIWLLVIYDPSGLGTTDNTNSAVSTIWEKLEWISWSECGCEELGEDISSAKDEAFKASGFSDLICCDQNLEAWLQMLSSSLSRSSLTLNTEWSSGFPLLLSIISIPPSAKSSI